MTDDERFDNMIATVAATSAQLAARMTTFKSHARATPNTASFSALARTVKRQQGVARTSHLCPLGSLQMAGSPVNHAHANI